MTIPEKIQQWADWEHKELPILQFAYPINDLADFDYLKAGINSKKVVVFTEPFYNHEQMELAMVSLWFSDQPTA